MLHFVGIIRQSCEITSHDKTVSVKPKSLALPSARHGERSSKREIIDSEVFSDQAIVSLGRSGMFSTFIPAG